MDVLWQTYMRYEGPDWETVFRLVRDYFHMYAYCYSWGDGAVLGDSIPDLWTISKLRRKPPVITTGILRKQGVRLRGVVLICPECLRPLRVLSVEKNSYGFSRLTLECEVCNLRLTHRCYLSQGILNRHARLCENTVALIVGTTTVMRLHDPGMQALRKVVEIYSPRIVIHPSSVSTDVFRESRTILVVRNLESELSEVLVVTYEEGDPEVKLQPREKLITTICRRCLAPRGVCPCKV